MDNKFGMEQPDNEEDITKEKVFGWSLFAIVNDCSLSRHCSSDFLNSPLCDLHRATVVVGATSHVSDALAWSCTLSGSTLMRIHKRRKSC